MTVNEIARLAVQNASLRELSEIDCHPYGGGKFQKLDGAISFVDQTEDGKDRRPLFICSLLNVLAKTRDQNSDQWGLLLEWSDHDKVMHRWAMPMELLQGDGIEIRRELSRMGLSISPTRKARDLLAAYLSVWPIKDRARCVERLGWFGGVYVTASEAIGNANEIIVFQNAHATEPALSAMGTADQWRESVAKPAQGNSRIVFAISVSFAGALLELAGGSGGGIHFRGGSSTGKTTVLRVAASVWGNPEKYSRLWRATANGLEGLAAIHNDGTLILDELGQMDPREAGEAAYLLANGQGKTRANRTGAARQSARWRLLFLSAGEVSLSSLMAQANKRATAGQEVRLADIPADAGAGMGAFEAMHGYDTPAAFALGLSDAAAQNHGAVGIEWLRKIVANRPKLADFIADGMRQFLTEVVPNGASGQVQRVAQRFALIAVAGELATHYRLTGWLEGEAISASKTCFGAWLQSFGGAGNREDRAILDQVRAFFEAHGASRFQNMDGGDQRILNRVGFFRDGPKGREYLVLTEAFNSEVCKGLDAKTAAKLLKSEGWIETGNDNRTTQKLRVPGFDVPQRCYVFNSRMGEADR